MAALIIAGGIAAALALAVFLQAQWLRRRLMSAATAEAEQRGIFNGDRPTLTIWAVGEGGGTRERASDYEDNKGEGLVARSAAELARLSGRRVRWQVRGKKGLRAAQVSLDQLPASSDAAPDLLIFVLGVGDTVGLRRVSAWRRDLNLLLETVRTRISDTVPILFTGIPPMHHLRPLPWPLRWLLGVHGGRLDRALCDLARTQARVWYLATPPGEGHVLGTRPSRANEKAGLQWARTLAQGCMAVLHPHAADRRGVPGLHMMVGGVGGGELRLR